MSRGDHIYIQCIPHTHHAIDLGEGNVIEYSVKEGIRLRSKQDFSENKFIYTKRYTECFSSEETIKRAFSRLGERKYHLFKNNCEHFACWCKTGICQSEQVYVCNRVSSNAVAALGNAGGQALAASAAKKALNPVAKVLVNTGIKQSPKVLSKTTAGIAGVGGLVTGLATDTVVNKMYEDKPHLSRHEREARKKGRIAGQVGSTVGAIGGTVAAGVVGGTAAAVTSVVAAPVVLGIGAAMGVHWLSKKK